MPPAAIFTSTPSLIDFLTASQTTTTPRPSRPEHMGTSSSLMARTNNSTCSSSGTHVSNTLSCPHTSCSLQLCSPAYIYVTMSRTLKLPSAPKILYELLRSCGMIGFCPSGEFEIMQRCHGVQQREHAYNTVPKSEYDRCAFLSLKSRIDA
jgi:hypothetical protein